MVEGSLPSRSSLEWRNVQIPQGTYQVSKCKSRELRERENQQELREKSTLIQQTKDGFVVELASEGLQDEQEYYRLKRRKGKSRQRNPQEQRPINVTVQDLGQGHGAVL